MKKKAKTNLNTQGPKATGKESNPNNCDSDENEDDLCTKVDDDDDSINFGDNNYEDNASDRVSSSTDKSPGKGGGGQYQEPARHQVRKCQGL